MDLDELVARAEVADVLARYVRGADRGDWDLVRSCYHPDAVDDHGLYRGGVEGLMAFLQDVSGRFTATTHHLGNQLVEVHGDAARAETSCLAWYRTAAGGGRTVAQGLRYLDRLERRDGRWAISERTVVLDWEHLLAASPEPAVAATWSRGARGPQDPSEAFWA